jgi:hypothetical protein
MLEALGALQNEQTLPWLPEAPTVVTKQARGTAPVVELVSADTHDALWCRRSTTLRIHPSPDAANGATLVIVPKPKAESGLDTYAVNDHPVATTPAGLLLVRNVPQSGISFVASRGCDKPLDEIIVSQVESGLPPGTLAASVAAARPPTAAASQEGDVTVLTTRVRVR